MQVVVTDVNFMAQFSQNQQGVLIEVEKALREDQVGRGLLFDTSGRLFTIVESKTIDKKTIQELFDRRASNNAYWAAVLVDSDSEDKAFQLVMKA